MYFSIKQNMSTYCVNIKWNFCIGQVLNSQGSFGKKLNDCLYVVLNANPNPVTADLVILSEKLLHIVLDLIKCNAV